MGIVIVLDVLDQPLRGLPLLHCISVAVRMHAVTTDVKSSCHILLLLIPESSSRLLGGERILALC